MTEAQEVDPFVKRVVTVNLGDRVIFKITRDVTPEQFDAINARLESKMGEIAFVLVDKSFDVTVLKQPSNSTGIHIA